MFLRKLVTANTCSELGPWVSSIYVTAAAPDIIMLKLAILSVGVSQSRTETQDMLDIRDASDRSYPRDVVCRADYSGHSVLAIVP